MQPDPIESPPRLTMREVGWFFFPLLLNVQMMSISHSVINAALARTSDAVAALAAFSVAMVLHIFVASPSYQNHIITIAMVRGRKSFRATAGFILLTSSFIAAVLALLAFTPFGSFVLDHLLGVTPPIAAGARAALAIMVLLPFVTGVRGLCQGLVSQTRRTSLISFATGVRIAALFLFLWMGYGWFDGPRLGAIALVGCVVVETVLIAFFAWRTCRIPEQGEAERDLAGVMRFAFPLVYSSGLQQAVPLLINAIISRLPDGTLALAAFGIIRGFIFLLASPMRNLQQAYLALAAHADDYAVMARFANRVSLALALVTLATAGPLSPLVLGTLMGLDPAMRSAIVWPLAACAIYPWLIGASHLLRGWFAETRLTAVLGHATLYKVLLLLACWPALVLNPVPVSGTAVAIALLVMAEAAETWYLHRQRSRLLPGIVADRQVPPVE
ncbi:MAG: MATE family efflux transporter [Desulfuromonadales bacterium]